MSLAPRLDLRQSHSLVMTPQLQQAIKLLALSNLEIEGFIAEELEKNPLLEAGPEEGDAPEREAVAVESTEPATADQLIAAGEGAADQPLDVDYDAETFIHDGPTDAGPGMDGALGMDGTRSGAGLAADGDGYEATLVADLSLHDHLMAQAGMVLAGTELIVAGHLIDLIDEAGYLTGRIEEVAEQLGLPVAAVERVLGVLQGLEPTGVAARGLAECLALQAREADRYDPCMAALIANLDLVARGSMAQLRRLCCVDDEDLADMIRELRRYDPKPGLRFGGGRIEAVSPDIFVARRGAGWAIELNSATLPRVLLNRSYYVELSGGVQDKASKAWLAECVASANWLVKALDQRARTIVKVATELVQQQEAFFRHGVTHLRPLTLRTVADAIGMHESTISRVTSNKYLSCERGLFELKYFFTSGIQSADGGEAASAEAVKDAIGRLIAAEGAAVLSDDALVDLLKARGFDIARRTVAKYREAIGLGSSVQRRRQKALGG
ncbi:RNA polymerase factor sigma-54 [Sphingomonas prati]|uniref:RNA polymerase sigma-54 factor n=1 Tax=Sphingomonas prati TaxID=1843237 RepID=A0A7W9F248_9SPHN|nr:RNA polymerase factor sigma-54 [Sphingomonas prati]MBB5730142.1 RNA polymerase sigma-54 factor [Sphingomonas prati]GGE91820.1 RNA polymerase sigma-54 factor 2 [Sphingomonas prati]